MNFNLQDRLPALKMPWKRGIAVGRAYELLRADVLEHLTRANKAVGFEYCRFHGIFHDDMHVVVRRPDGRLAFQWGHVDRILDALLAIGLKPFVELNPMPKALASGSETFFHWNMNVTPPKDFDEWGELVTAFVIHVRSRYGVEEVRKWHFEVWNEPNLWAFWAGSQADYFRLYQVSANSVKGVDPELRIGGPVSAESGWIGEFIEFCAESGTALDFISTHLYPQNEFVFYKDSESSPHEPGEFFEDRLREVDTIVKGSRLPHLPVHWTEWNSLSSSSMATVDWLQNPTVDSIYGAALVAKSCIGLDEVVDSLCWWVASDVFEEAGIPQSPFSGTYGLLTFHGVPKPTYHAFHFLSRLRGERLALKETGYKWGGAVATEESGIVRAVVWHHVPLGHGPETWSGDLTVLGFSDPCMVTTQQVRVSHGSAFEAWSKAGRQQNPTEAQLEALHAMATPACLIEVKNEASVRFELAPGEILFVEFAPGPDPFIPKSTMTEEAQAWNVGMGALALDEEE